jgi:hypothetical protein
MRMAADGHSRWNIPAFRRQRPHAFRLPAPILALLLALTLTGCEFASPNPAATRANALLTAFFEHRLARAHALLSGGYEVPIQEDYAVTARQAAWTHTPLRRVRWTMRCAPTRIVRESQTSSVLRSCQITFNQRWLSPLTLSFDPPLSPAWRGTFTAFSWDTWLYEEGGPTVSALAPYLP